MVLQAWVGLLTGWSVLMGVLAWRLPSWRPEEQGPFPWRTHLSGAGERVGRWMPLDDTERWLIWAGRPYRLQAGEFWVIRLLAGISLGALGLALGPGVSFLGLCVGLMAPALWLKGRATRRQGQMERELLPLLDLWAAAVEAGLPPVPALNRVSARTGGLLAEEFAQAAREVATGRPLAGALAALAERTGLAELEIVVKTLIQADRYGTPLTRLLREMVSQIRLERRQQAQAIAGKAAVRMMIPMVLFIFGPFLVMLLAPAFWHLKGVLH